MSAPYTKLTKAELIRLLHERDTRISALVADACVASAPSALSPALDVHGVHKDEQGYYVLRSEHATPRAASTACAAAARALNAVVRLS